MCEKCPDEERSWVFNVLIGLFLGICFIGIISLASLRERNARTGVESDHSGAGKTKQS